MRIILAIFMGSILFSCREDQSSIIKSKSETFLITCNKEYDLKLRNNDKLTIYENTFICNNVDSFQLVISYIKNKKDIVLSGIQTTSIDNVILESGGMFKLNYPSSIEINPNKPAEYRVSQDYIYSEMEQFEYDKNSNSWAPMNIGKLKNTGSKIIQTGKESYMKNCSGCHAKDLGRDGTGPALGRIEKFRNKDWLIDYTINSQFLTQRGDSVANCLWNIWKPTVMTTFTHLDTNEIKAIYSYIENESEVTKIEIDSSRFIIPCNVPSNVESKYFYPQGSINPQSDYYYIAKVYSNSWYNVDYFLNFESKIENPELFITNSNGRVKTVIAFTNYNTVIRFQDYNGKLILSNSFGKEKINWPKDEEVYIISYALDINGEIVAGKVIKHFFKESNNKIEVELEEMSSKELNAKLKELEISN